ncbi:MAG: hypothetical protein J7647_21900 [Cyanobacteria bacterium SBLK]|nr:hypothetical protein [Cyanobacteria bacterium SBLK]
MARLVKFLLEDGTFVYIEVDEKLPLPAVNEEEDEPGLIGIGDDLPRIASQKFEEALNAIRPVANAIVDKVQSLNRPADEVEVKFGVKMSAGLGAIIASGNAEVNYEITLKWNNTSGNPN